MYGELLEERVSCRLAPLAHSTAQVTHNRNEDPSKSVRGCSTNCVSADAQLGDVIAVACGHIA